MKEESVRPSNAVQCFWFETKLRLIITLRCGIWVGRKKMQFVDCQLLSFISSQHIRSCIRDISTLSWLAPNNKIAFALGFIIGFQSTRSDCRTLAIPCMDLCRAQSCDVSMDLAFGGKVVREALGTSTVANAD